MNAKAASRVEAIAAIRVFVFARIPPPEDEKKEALRSCSLRGFDFILVILVFVVFGDGDGGCRRGQRGEQRGEQKKKEEALKFLPKLNSQLMKVVKSGIIKKQNASRNVSRITKKISAL